MKLDQLEWAMITVIFVLLTALFILLIVIPKQYEKNKKKRSGKKEVGQYDSIIDDYPTYTRNQK